MSDMESPWLASPMAWAAARRDWMASYPDITNILNLSTNTLINEDVVAVGMDKIWQVTLAQTLTRHKSLCVEACMVIVSNFWLFFWSSNVNDKTVAESTFDNIIGMIVPSMMREGFGVEDVFFYEVKQILISTRKSVSQKKKRLCRGRLWLRIVLFWCGNIVRMYPGSTFCCIKGGSLLR